MPIMLVARVFSLYCGHRCLLDNHLIFCGELRLWASLSEERPPNHVDRCRRNCVIGAHPDEGQFSEPIPAAQPERRELLKVPPDRTLLTVGKSSVAAANLD
jgi:hypothetical protein